MRHLVLAAIDRDANTVADYDIVRAIRLVTLKLVGFTEIVHSLLDRLTDDASVVVFGGMAKERPYPGSTTVSTVNGGVVGLTRSLVEELKPRRVNSIHPGIVGDSPFWAEKASALENYRSQTPTGRLATMADIVDATVFLLENTVGQRHRPARRQRLALPLVPGAQRFAAFATSDVASTSIPCSRAADMILRAALCFASASSRSV